MKRTILISILSFLSVCAMAQSPKIENTRLSLSSTADSLIVKYDLVGSFNAFNINIEVTDSMGNAINAKTVSGDIGGNIYPGVDKTIYWNMSNDQVDVYGSFLNVRVYTKVAINHKVKRNVWSPCLYIASGAFVATGLYSHQKANTLYEKYKASSQSNEVQQYSADVKRYDTISIAAFGAALGSSIIGVIIHQKYICNKKDISLAYIPVKEGAVVGLTYNF